MSHDTLLHRSVRPFVRRLALTSVQPNHITVLRIVSALGAAYAFAQGTAPSIWTGAGLFAVSALLDRADGELARLTKRFSTLGHRLDLVADCGANVTAFLAMGIGASNGWLHQWSLVFGILAALGTASLFWQLNRPSATKRPLPRSRLIDPDDTILIVPILACSVGLAPVLLLAGCITPLAAIWQLTRRASHQPVSATAVPPARE